jgi:threonine dehydrogenase-like Zn-dependent dehydrogenase
MRAWRVTCRGAAIPISHGVKAIRFAAPIPTYLATKIVGAVSRTGFVGPHACTRFENVAEPILPNDQWVRVRTRLGGICGSDLNIITLSASPSTSPLSSFPFVLGHENVGDVIEVGRRVRRVAIGDRVSVNPLLSCTPRGIEPLCPSCLAGDQPRCEHFTDGPLPPGMLIGTTRGLGGSWGEQFVAHESQVLRVPDVMSDEQALLIEPFACAVHAVRANLPQRGHRALVIGAGSIGLLTTAALHALAPESVVTVAARYAFQKALATRLGANGVVEARGDYLPALAEAGGTRLLKPILGKPIGVGGFDTTFVCVGGPAAIDDAMRFTRAGGTIVLLGNTSTARGLDWTPLWLKELTVRGSLCYGAHHGGPSGGAFEEAANLIATGAAPVAPLLTHTFGLAEYGRAIATAADKGRAESVKVAFRF